MELSSGPFNTSGFASKASPTYQPCFGENSWLTHENVAQILMHCNGADSGVVYKQMMASTCQRRKQINWKFWNLDVKQDPLGTFCICAAFPFTAQILTVSRQCRVFAVTAGRSVNYYNY
mmetsp:Transcript_20811/g.57303  ORF Transcript_20811/g.57303 Transcript_20811/m.57303 type:complete len:119 (+) Transcript_20811:491-847(+)